MIYTQEETRRFQALLTAFESFISAGKYFDILYSPKRGYIHALLETGSVEATYIEDSDELFEWLVTEATHDVRDLFLCGPHDTVDLFPEEIQESRARLSPYINRLPDDLQPYFIERMEYYFAHCNDKYENL